MRKKLVSHQYSGMTRDRNLYGTRRVKFEYDQEKHLKMEREEAWDQGRAEGEKRKLIQQIQKKLAKGKTAAQIAEELEEEEALIHELIKKM